MVDSTRGSLSALQFLGIVEAMDQLGIDAKPVLAVCGLAMTQLHNPFARLDAALEHTFWTALERSAGDAAISLKIGVEMAQRGRRGVDTYIAFNAHTLRDLFESVERFAKLSDDRGHVQLLEAGAFASVRIYRDGGYPRAHGYVEALFAGSVFNFKRRVPEFRLSRVRLPRPQPKDPAPYFAAFGVMPCFGSATADVSFERALLDVPLVGSDAALAELLKEYASDLLRKIPAIDPLLYAVQRALFDGLKRGQVSLAAIARATGTSTRTLRRRLSELGTSFHDELDKLRQDLAAQQLRDGHVSIAQITEHLGFASTKAFQRAFRRWTGLTPTSYRQQERGAEPAPTAGGVPACTRERAVALRRA